MPTIDPANPRVSVALATYNGATYLPALLESLGRQTLQPFEIIAFDDGSSDDSRAVLNQFSQRLPLSVYTNEQSVGVVENFRRAVAACRGDYIAFCDQDDVWLPDKLALSVSKMVEIDGSQPAMVFTDLTVVDERLQVIANSYWQHCKLNPARETFASLLWGNFVTGFTMVINRPMAEEVAQMPPHILMHDYWVACVAYGVGRCAYVDQPTALYRQHSSNVTINDAVTWLSRQKRLIEFLRNDKTASLYLQPQLEQARLFHEIYYQRMSLSNQQTLTNFLAKKGQLPLRRKWSAFIVKFLHLHR